MSVQTRYEAEIAAGTMRPDPAQAAAVSRLQALLDRLASAPAPRPKTGLLARLGRRLGSAPPAPVQGIYMWGGVGRGKTHLMNVFHDELPLEDKWRIHFHRFMSFVHAERRKLGHVEDPLKHIADEVAGRVRVLCLDEFHVSDIADAMLLGRLLTALFERGVTMVATSNVAPDGLYRDGLQRSRFLPAIEVIKAHNEVLHLDGDEDFRLRALERAEIYHSPLDAGAEESLARSFAGLGPENVREAPALEVEGRTIPAVRTADGLAWFEFTALCDGPRSTADYIEIARCFHTVFIANVPRFGEADDDRAIRFVHLVDEFYDRNVNLIVSAETGPERLYAGTRHAFAFERTASRLLEMQSREYLHREHLA